MTATVTSIKRPEAEPGTFDEFWLWVPGPAKKRSSKALCRAKWDAITNGGMKTKTFDRDSNSYVEIFLQATATEIIEGMKRFDASWREPNGTYGQYRDGGKYIPGPAVWLNRGSWES